MQTLDKEAILRHTLETTQVGYWEWDIANQRCHLSSRYRTMFNYGQRLPDSDCVWSLGLHADDIATTTAAYERHVASRGEIPFDINARYCHPNGAIMWMQCRGRVIAWDDAGRPLRMVGNHTDITAQQQGGQKLVRYHEALTSLQKIATKTHLSINEQIDAALVVVSGYLSLPIGILSKIEGKKYQITNLFKPADFALEAGQTVALGDTYCSFTYQTDQAVGIHHVSETEWAMHPCYQTIGLQTYIAAPVKVHSRPYGTVNFSSPMPRPHPFCAYDLEFIELLASWIGYILERQSAVQMLELMVQKRTHALAERNQQLADFAFLNAHKMRSPLARILGLTELLSLTDSRIEEKQYISFITKSAQELDAVIKSASSTLGALSALDGLSKISSTLTSRILKESIDG